MCNKLAVFYLTCLTFISKAANIDNVKFQIFEVDDEIQDILWCGKSNEVIFVQTELGTIYRSRDKGDSWKKLDDLMKKTAYSVADED